MATQTPATARALVLAVRKAYGISQATLAAKIGRSPATVYRWEKGTTEPTLSDARRLERMLDRAP